MTRTFTEDFSCTPTELADEFWKMSAMEQIEALHAIQTRFFVIPADGESQLASMGLYFNTYYGEEYKKAVKHFIAQLQEYLFKE